jgi:nitrogen fixation protein NifU and related proteins
VIARGHVAWYPTAGPVVPAIAQPAESGPSERGEYLATFGVNAAAASHIRPQWSEFGSRATLSGAMDDLYRDYILEHYRRPHNFGVIDNPDASYEGANPLCGDRITLMLGVKDGIVDRVAFTGRGCAISQASASLLTDEIKGKPLAEVAAFRADDLLDLLGIEISPARLKCAMLSHDSLQHTLTDLGAAEQQATA